MKNRTKRSIERYCQKRIEGDTQRQAYRSAFPQSKRWKDETVDSKACVLEKSDKVQERLAELQKEADELAEKEAQKACLTRTQKRQILARLAADPDASASDICRAIDLDNKMQGEYIEKVSVSGEINNPFKGLSTEDLLKLVGDV